MKDRIPDVSPSFETCADISLVSVILPTYNEASNIVPLINRIHTALESRPKEILVVDDNSPDRTWELAQQVTGKDVRVIRRTSDRGLVKSIRCGIENSLGKYVVWMDADQSMPPEFIPLLVNELKDNDIAVASRYVKGGKDQRPLVRLITSRMINLTANLMLNFNVLDLTSGFIAARKEVFNNLSLADSAYGEYCIEFLYKAGKQGKKIKEIPYSFIDRLEGTSKTAGSISTLIRYGAVYFKRVINLRFRR
ncbi:MAG TPA: polyprenol monophosphomannose synthase [Candidatus Nanoarchaeia archaeon]|nr:polyprenol monophosphomannose synthase [Candidatus Nanoarchaeia archaeon]